MKLIDKDALVAEIDRLDALYHTSKDLGGDLFIQGLYCFLDTIEGKEVDIDKEIEQSFIDLDYHLDTYNRVEDYVGENLDLVEYKRIAEHFFELGLKAKQSKIKRKEQ